MAERPVPPYLQIADAIRGKILAGELRDGTRIASARQLAKTWNVALATATKALTLLQSEGYTRPLPGVGTVVSPGSPQGPICVVTDGDTLWLQCFADDPDAERGQIICPLDPGTAWPAILRDVMRHQAGHGCTAGRVKR